MSTIFNDLVIFEMANNHQGSIEHGLSIIRQLGKTAKKYKINAAVKLQYRNLDTLIHPDYRERTDVKHIPRFLSTKLDKSQFKIFVDEIKNNGMLTMSTPFDEESVDVCIEHELDIIKIASCSAIDWPLLQKVAMAQKPVIISTGGKTFSEIDNIYNFMVHRNVTFSLLHCVGMYPVAPQDIQLNCIDKMINRYPKITIGYSGHEDPQDYSIVQMAIAKGAKIFERHVGMETDAIKLNAYSTDVKEVDNWIEAINKALVVCGGFEEKNIPQEEIDSMNSLARGCYASRKIKKGDVITEDDVFYAMPCMEDQTTSGQFKVGSISSKDYDVNEAIFEQSIKTVISDTRTLAHDIKSMLFEAKICLNNDFELELSHHFGLENFKAHGAAIVNIINREYCKKLIVILPNQQHPMHAHKVKEESFHVLSGTLTLTLNGETKDFYEGDVVTVERGVPHAFTSEKGCIFEEISTTHVKNDSYYDDPLISSLDPIERKTILREW